jgi:hypothetical protein
MYLIRSHTHGKLEGRLVSPSIVLREIQAAAVIDVQIPSSLWTTNVSYAERELEIKWSRLSHAMRIEKQLRNE